MNGKLFWNKLTMYHRNHPTDQYHMDVILTIPYVLTSPMVTPHMLTRLLKDAVNKQLISVEQNLDLISGEATIELNGCPHYKIESSGLIAYKPAAIRQFTYKVMVGSAYITRWDEWYAWQTNKL
jgi:hypothetical protein